MWCEASWLRRPKKMRCLRDWRTGLASRRLRFMNYMNWPDHYQRAARALHEDTHFHLVGQSDARRTSVGTRPGDSWADVVFSFAWAKMLHGLQEELVQHDVLDAFDNPRTWQPFGRVDDLEFESVPFLGPTWMDDLSLGVSGATCAEAVGKIGFAANCLIDRCTNFGTTPNLARGKTEILLSLRGPGSRKMKTQFFEGQLLVAFQSLVNMAQRTLLWLGNMFILAMSLRRKWS